jgi:gamma-glutamyl-gamma-aminobutyrate hydrolase PuuD
MKKTIGIYGDVFNGRVGQTEPYMQFFSQFGHVRIITTSDNLREVAKNIDALVIPGGADVDAMRYYGIPGFTDSRVNQHYEYLDKYLLPLIIELKKPIIGICRGMQSLNVHFGGTLNQDISGHHQGDNRSSTKQEIQFEDGTSHFVNTMHHQSVDVLGKGFKIAAYGQMFAGCFGNRTHVRNWKSQEENNKVKYKDIYVVVEMIVHEELPIVAFQWHPEEFNCYKAVDTINNLLKKDEKKAVRIN